MSKRRELTETEKKFQKIANRLGIFFACLIIFHVLFYSIIFSINDWVCILIFSLLFIAPAYLANAGMVFTGGGKPIDGGKVLKDGRRLFGDHKTWSGLLKGPLYVGILCGSGLLLLFLALWQFIGPAFQLAINYNLYTIYDNLIYMEYYFVGGPLPLGSLLLFIRIVISSYSAGIGDLVGSFLKRRFDIKSGAPFWIVDQLDFALITILFISVPAIIAPSLFWTPDIHIFMFIMIITPSISILGNNVAWLAGVKEVPW
jgi:CDP-2,3-bis-(O-geranylgeranyl)-sn-glycerol synthase